MAAKTDPLLGLKYGWALGEDNWNTGMDANLLTIAALLQLVVSSSLATPPESPAAGERYLVAASPTGEWTGQAQKIAVYTGTAWSFFAAKNGFMCFNLGTGTLWRYTGVEWVNMFAVTGDMTSATSATLIATPAGVREFLESLGWGASYINTTSDLNSVSGAADKNVPFNFGSTTAHSPVDGSYGRGIQFASGGNYSTQIAWLNGSTDSYIRFNNGGTWTEWSKQGFNQNDNTNTPWLTMTLQNGWTTTSGSRCVYRKVFGKLQVWFSAQQGSTTGNVLLFTFPVGYRLPFAASNIVASTAATAGVATRVVIFADGRLESRNCNGSIDFILELPLE